tara:strand:+ start:395 stop:604 length:210 start_codon:yes stop_codon:yes gene_type:complete
MKFKKNLKIIKKYKKIEETSAYDIPYFVSSNFKISRKYNWQPRKNLLDIVNDIYKWQKKNFKLLKPILN